MALVPITVGIASVLQASASSPVISDRPYMALFAAALSAVVGFVYLYPASGGPAPYLSVTLFLALSIALAGALDSWQRALRRVSATLDQLRAHEHELQAAKDAAEVATARRAASSPR